MSLIWGGVERQHEYINLLRTTATYSESLGELQGPLILSRRAALAERKEQDRLERDAIQPMAPSSFRHVKSIDLR